MVPHDDEGKDLSLMYLLISSQASKDAFFEFSVVNKPKAGPRGSSRN